MKHPAKFTDSVLKTMHEVIPSNVMILDPFAGTGGIHKLQEWDGTRTTIGVEIEPEWADMHWQTWCGNALHLPYGDLTFDVIATSPCYANRFADHHEAKDGSVRRSYTHDLGRKLHEDNAGAMQWGEQYRRFHIEAWRESIRVLKRNGLFVLNISDHVRNKKIVPVSDWHAATLQEFGLILMGCHEITTPRMRYGKNRERVDYERLFVFQKPEY